MLPSTLAHFLAIEHGATGDAALALGLLTLGVFASTVIGIAVGNEATCRLPRAMLVAVCAGMLLFLLFDLLKESAGLGQGLVANPLLAVGLLLAFAAGYLVIPTFAREDGTVRLAWMWAIGIALHGMGEGYTLGTEATTADITGVAGIASFLIHKGLEAFTIPILLTFGLGWRGTLLVGGFLAGTTLLAGSFGLYLGSTTIPLFLFAAGAGATSSAMLRFAREIPSNARHAAWVIVGVLLVYAAGLLHEVG